MISRYDLRFWVDKSGKVHCNYYVYLTEIQGLKIKLDIWGKAQRESVWRRKSNWGKIQRAKITPVAKSRGPKLRQILNVFGP